MKKTNLTIAIALLMVFALSLGVLAGCAGLIPDEPTEPQGTEPPVDPTEPPVDPTEPPVDPTDPPVDPTEPPHTHTPGAEATCTAPQICTVCNEELTPAKGHTAGAETTCTAPQICTVCNAELTPAKGHSFGDNNPTCGNCGAENPDYIPPTTEPPTTEHVVVIAPITNWLVSGSFVNDKVWPAGNGDGSTDPQQSCDASAITQWNPQANGSYAVSRVSSLRWMAGMI